MNKAFRTLERFVLLMAFCVVLSVSVFAHPTEAASTGSFSVVVIYGVVAVLSLLLLLTYVLFLHRKERWFLILFLSVFVTNLGYFLLSVSGTLGEAMLANRISYLGSVLLPLCMLMIILGLCDMKPGKTGTGILWLLTGGVFGIGWLVDFIKILVGKFTDKEGRPLEK